MLTWISSKSCSSPSRWDERERKERKGRERRKQLMCCLCRIDTNRASVSAPPFPLSLFFLHSHPSHPSDSSVRMFSSSSPWPTPRQPSRQTRPAMLLARSPSSSALTKSQELHNTRPLPICSDVMDGRSGVDCGVFERRGNGRTHALVPDAFPYTHSPDHRYPTVIL